MVEIGSGDTLIKFAPPAAVAGADVVSTLFGLTLSEWFYVGMIVYMVIMAVNDYKDKRSARKIREAQHEQAMRKEQKEDGQV